MQIHLLAVGQKMPVWVKQGYQTFSQRMPAECRLLLKEIPALKRPKHADIKRIQAKEAQKLLQAIPRYSHVIALDVKGKPWSTEQLAEQLKRWMMSGRDVSLLVGGPEGLTDACRSQADALWSLSPLTFPHPLVRVILAEQLYRAWSLSVGHPYHRGESCC